MRWSLVIVAVLAVAGCTGHVDKDDRPEFTIDRSQPFLLQFGRGSGWHGLDTVKLDQSGLVVLHRMKSSRQAWEVASLQLPPESLGEVLKAVEANRLTALHKAYHEDIEDGTQWVLWIKQGDQEKSVYFNNRFPPEITRFAEQLDAILARAGLDKVTWQPVTGQKSRQHEKELWDSIKR